MEHLDQRSMSTHDMDQTQNDRKENGRGVALSNSHLNVQRQEYECPMNVFLPTYDEQIRGQTTLVRKHERVVGT